MIISSLEVFGKGGTLTKIPGLIVSIRYEQYKKVNLQRLSQSYPSIKLEVDKDSQTLTIFPGTENWTQVHYVIIDHLGAEGWEPFAITEGCIHFKRSY